MIDAHESTISTCRPQGPIGRISFAELLPQLSAARWRTLLCLAFCLTLSPPVHAAGIDPRIIGAWSETGRAPIQMEFYDDGTMIIPYVKDSEMMQCRWTVLSDGRLKITMSMWGTEQFLLSTVEFAGNDIVLTNSEGARQRLKRIVASRDHMSTPPAVTDNSLGEKQFSATSLKQTQLWADNIKADLLAVGKQGNAIVYKEAQNAAKRSVEAIIGTKVTWTVHVTSVEENGTVKFTEIFDTESFSAPILAMDQSLTIFFADSPSFSPEALRALRAGDAVEISATIKKAALKESMLAPNELGVNIVLQAIAVPRLAAGPISEPQHPAQSQPSPVRSSIANELISTGQAVALNDRDVVGTICPAGQLGEFTHGTRCTGYYDADGLVDIQLSGVASMVPRERTKELVHPGIDIVASEGSPIFPIGYGTVVDVIDSDSDRNWKSLGYMVMVEHSESPTSPKYYSLYLHMKQKPEVEVGSVVVAGKTRLGLVGHTGAAYGNHVHVEVRTFKDRFNPTWKNIYGKLTPESEKTFDENTFEKEWRDPERFGETQPAASTAPALSATQKTADQPTSDNRQQPASQRVINKMKSWGWRVKVNGVDQ